MWSFSTYYSTKYRVALRGCQPASLRRIPEVELLSLNWCKETLDLGERKEKEEERLPCITRKECSKEALLALKSTLLGAGKGAGRGQLF